MLYDIITRVTSHYIHRSRDWDMQSWGSVLELTTLRSYFSKVSKNTWPYPWWGSSHGRKEPVQVKVTEVQC